MTGRMDYFGPMVLKFECFSFLFFLLLCVLSFLCKGEPCCSSRIRCAWWSSCYQLRCLRPGHCSSSDNSQHSRHCGSWHVRAQVSTRTEFFLTKKFLSKQQAKRKKNRGLQDPTHIFQILPPSLEERKFEAIVTKEKELAAEKKKLEDQLVDLQEKNHALAQRLQGAKKLLPSLTVFHLLRSKRFERRCPEANVRSIFLVARRSECQNDWRKPRRDSRASERAVDASSGRTNCNIETTPDCTAEQRRAAQAGEHSKEKKKSRSFVTFL